MPKPMCRILKEVGFELGRKGSRMDTNRGEGTSHSKEVSVVKRLSQ